MRADEAGEHADGGGLACAVGAQEAEGLAGMDGEGDTVDDFMGGEGFGKVFDEDHSLGAHFTCGRVYHTIYAFSSAIFHLRVRTVVFFSRLSFVGQTAAAT